MKKIRAVFTACLSILVLLTACTGNQPSGGNSSQIPSREEASAPSSSSDPINTAPRIEMQMQEYFDRSVVEMPRFAFAGTNEQAQALNDRIDDQLLSFYNEWEKSKADGFSIEMKSYPFTSADYVQVLTTSIGYPTYGTDGNIYSYNYDIASGQIITIEQALAKASLTSEAIAQVVKDTYVPEWPQCSVGEVKVSAFRLDDDDVIFYLNVTIENLDADPWVRIYTYTPADDALIEYDGQCLVDPSAPDVMDPPLSYSRIPEMPAESEIVPQ